MLKWCTMPLRQSPLQKRSMLLETTPTTAKLAVDMFHYTKEDLYDGVEAIITVGDFYKESAGEGVHMLFI